MSKYRLEYRAYLNPSCKDNGVAPWDVFKFTAQDDMVARKTARAFLEEHESSSFELFKSMSLED